MGLLEVEDLYVQFDLYEGVAQVVNGVSLTVRESDRVGLVGETGCGKSVTMKATLGLLPMPPAKVPRGQVRLRNRDILGMKAKDLNRYVRGEKVSYVPQDPMGALNPVFRIGRQLLDVIKYNAGKKLSTNELTSEAIESLSTTKLPDPKRIMKNYPFELSGGMQQRVLIAMALVTNPELLILDEPGTALDVTIQDQILRLLLELSAGQHLGFLVITHNLGVIRRLTDKLYIMYAGNVMEAGFTTDILSDPLHLYTQGLLRSVPKLTGEGIAGGIKGRIPDYFNPPKGCRFHPRCDSSMAICKEKAPPLRELREGRFVACFSSRGSLV